MAKILLVEDEIDLADAIKDWLVAEHYHVETALSGQEAITKLNAGRFDIVLLDWMLPESSGIDVCRSYRTAGGTTPVIMLTAKKSLLSKETGLDSGADDYLTKPFQLRELSARIRALLRRTNVQFANVLEAGDLKVDRQAHKVIKGQQIIHLLPKEFALLEFFMRNQGKILTVEDLLDQVWGTESEVAADTVRSNIKTLRRKIDTPGLSSLIVTVHGVGYKFEVSDIH